MKNEKQVITSGIYRTIYHNDSYLLLFGNWKILNFEISYE